MDRQLELFSTIIGRILVGGFFLWNGIEQLLNPSAASAIFTQAGFPAPLFFVLLAAAIEIIGGIIVILGYQTRVTSLFLAIYLLLISTFLVKAADPIQLQLFLENMAVIGGLLYIAAYENRPQGRGGFR